MQTVENTAQLQPVVVDTYYTISELSERLKISRSTINNLVRDGKLNKTKVGKKTLFSAIEVNRYLSTNTKATN